MRRAVIHTLFPPFCVLFADYSKTTACSFWAFCFSSANCSFIPANFIIFMHYFFYSVWFDLILVHMFTNCNNKYMYYVKVYLNCIEGGFIWIIYNEFGIFVKMPTVRRLRLQNISEPLRLCMPDTNAEPMKCQSDIWLHCVGIIRSLPTISSASPISKNLFL